MDGKPKLRIYEGVLERYYRTREKLDVRAHVEAERTRVALTNLAGAAIRLEGGHIPYAVSFAGPEELTIDRHCVVVSGETFCLKELILTGLDGPSRNVERNFPEGQVVRIVAEPCDKDGLQIRAVDYVQERALILCALAGRAGWLAHIIQQCRYFAWVVGILFLLLGSIGGIWHLLSESGADWTAVGIMLGAAIFVAALLFFGVWHQSRHESMAVTETLRALGWRNPHNVNLATLDRNERSRRSSRVFESDACLVSFYPASVRLRAKQTGDPLQQVS